MELWIINWIFIRLGYIKCVLICLRDDADNFLLVLYDAMSNEYIFLLVCG